MHQVGSNDQWENVLFRKTDRCYLGFPGGSDCQESACNAGDSGSITGSGRFPQRWEWQPTPVFLPGEFHRQRNLVGYSPWGHIESDMTE